MRFRIDGVWNECSRALVVAPHPDDDAIGCGGVLASLVASGGEALVVYVSDGGASHPASRTHDAHAVAKVRANEARAALCALGVANEPVFLDLPDGCIGSLDATQRAEAVARVQRAIETFAADVVLAPWLRDPHPDHVASARLATDAWRRANANATLVYYEVWLPIRGARSDRPTEREARAIDVELDALALERKRRALFAHRSQFGEVIVDDPSAFRIDDALAARWLTPRERYYVPSFQREAVAW